MGYRTQGNEPSALTCFQTALLSAALNLPVWRSNCEVHPAAVQRRNKTMAQALEGITVLELSRVSPGAFCTMLLGDMGAEVLIETRNPLRLQGSGCICNRRRAGGIQLCES